MRTERGVLLLGGGEPGAAELRARIVRLGRPAQSAKNAEEALRLVSEPRSTIGAVLLPPMLPVPSVGGALRTLADHAVADPLVVVAVGARPELEVLSELRAAGVELALWEPFDDATLRFQLNRSLCPTASERRQTRVPVALPAEIEAAGRRKAASVYTLSAGGVFLETPSPSLSGVLLGMHLSLPQGRVRLAGRVAYTNVPGNLQRRILPVGMGIEFSPVPQEVAEQLQCLIAKREDDLKV